MGSEVKSPVAGMPCSRRSCVRSCFCWVGVSFPRIPARERVKRTDAAQSIELVRRPTSSSQVGISVDAPPSFLSFRFSVSGSPDGAAIARSERFPTSFICVLRFWGLVLFSFLTPIRRCTIPVRRNARSRLARLLLIFLSPLLVE